ncbi:hypothetical protein CPB85DRAFT_555497 [Mucidula mucida]|nr:hypothetical protein CPB85DRAFT_555497 [Mucidula mucida]
MLWLARRPEWQRAREFEGTTRTSSRSGESGWGFGDDDEDAGSDDELGGHSSGAHASAGWDGRPKTRVVFQPTFDTTHTIYYRGHWLRIRRGRKRDGSGCEMLSISVVARSNLILKQLVLEAKRAYEAQSVSRIQIYFAASHGSWSWTDSRHKRPMSSIVLNPGVKEMLLRDTRDFLASETWYASRGIPFRRGYLLHGVPGSGKSSLIHALAGELMLDIYVVSLSSSWISDSTLMALMGRVPSRCIVLLEDLDAAFRRSIGRRDEDDEDDSEDEKKAAKEKEEKEKKEKSTSRRRKRGVDGMSEVNTLSLSGLLNALDGVAAAEGRLLFATTNHLERLDPALSRPGRMDVWIEFKNASKWQAEALFRNFFPSAEEEKPINDFDESELAGIELPSPPSSSGSSTLWSMSPSAASSTTSLPSESTFGASNQAYLPPPVDPSIANSGHSAKPLSAKELGRLAKTFADGVPEDEFSVAALQGWLLRWKSNPDEAARGVGKWVEEEREGRKQREEKTRKRGEKKKAEKEKAKEETSKKAAEAPKELPAAPAPAPAPVPEPQSIVVEPVVLEVPAPAPEPIPQMPVEVVSVVVPPSPPLLPSALPANPILPLESDSESSSSDSDSDEEDELSSVKPNSVGWGVWH